MTTNYYQTLAMPGGGVRGCVSAIWLARLCKSGHVDMSKISLLSGTSTGSILVGALATELFKPEDLAPLFKELAPKIFKRNEWFPSFLSKAIFGSAYDIKNLKDVIEGVLGNIRVGDCKKKISITVYSLDERGPEGNRTAKPVFITNFDDGSNRADHILNMKLSSAIIGSCSAPTYFAPYRFKLLCDDDHGHKHKPVEKIYTDGGIIDNSSLMGALMNSTKKSHIGVIDDEELAILYLGNGANYWNIDPKKKDFWQLPRTASTVMSTLVAGGQQLSEQSMQAILGNRFRIQNSSLKEPVDLADHKKIDELIRFANETPLGETMAWCEYYFR